MTKTKSRAGLPRHSSRSCVPSVQLLAALLVLIACSSTFADDDHWVTTWACGEQLVEPNNLPPVPLASSTLREFVRNSIGGQTIRVRFSNLYGAGPVTINAAHVALSASVSIR